MFFFSFINRINFLLPFFQSAVPVPSAEELYLDDEISDINWDLLAFIMSLEDNVKVAIKSLPKEYRLICTILYAMVKVCQLIICKRFRIHWLILVDFFPINFTEWILHNESSRRNTIVRVHGS